MGVYINGGEQLPAKEVYVKRGGNWKPILEGWINTIDGNRWRQWWPISVAGEITGANQAFLLNGVDADVVGYPTESSAEDPSVIGAHPSGAVLMRTDGSSSSGDALRHVLDRDLWDANTELKSRRTYDYRFGTGDRTTTRRNHNIRSIIPHPVHGAMVADVHTIRKYGYDNATNELTFNEIGPPIGGAWSGGFDGDPYAEYWIGRDYVVDSNGYITQDAAGYVNAGFSDSAFGLISSLALNKDGSKCWVADARNSVIREIDFATETLSTLAGPYPTDGSFNDTQREVDIDGIGPDVSFNWGNTSVNKARVALDANEQWLYVSRSGSSLASLRRTAVTDFDNVVKGQTETLVPRRSTSAPREGKLSETGWDGEAIQFYVSGSQLLWAGTRCIYSIDMIGDDPLEWEQRILSGSPYETGNVISDVPLDNRFSRISWFAQGPRPGEFLIVDGGNRHVRIMT
jgi:hypothetical protein